MKWSLSALVLTTVIVTAAISTVGCKGGEAPSDVSEPESAPPAEDQAEAANAFPVQEATAVIAGKVLFIGDPPPREEVPAERIAAAKDELCILHHTDNPLLVEDLIVSDESAIRNVLVYVKTFPQDWTYAAAEDEVLVDQKGCAYVPHVLGVRVDQPVIVTSSDDTAHNVHLMAIRNRSVNFTLAKGDKKELTFKRLDKLGSSYFKCDIHSWMKCYVGVFEHPFFAVTGDDGTFELPKLPPGEYEIAAWHETLGTREQTITLKDGEALAAEFTFKQE